MSSENNIVQVEISGLSLTSSVAGGGYAIILKEINGERRLPIIIGQFEAQAIAFELERMHPPRPLTHDLLKNIIEYFGYSISKIIINEIKDSTFYAKIILDDSDGDEIDARPSDAIALALKFNAPIYVASNIMEEIGFIPETEDTEARKTEIGEDYLDNIDNIPEFEQTKPQEEKLTPKEKKLKKLKSELEEAVIKEDYEKAALLRDEIKKIELSNLN